MASIPHSHFCFLRQRTVVLLEVLHCQNGHRGVFLALDRAGSSSAGAALISGLWSSFGLGLRAIQTICSPSTMRPSPHRQRVPPSMTEAVLFPRRRLATPRAKPSRGRPWNPLRQPVGSSGYARAGRERPEELAGRRYQPSSRPQFFRF
jgi:hypothetical protein